MGGTATLEAVMGPGTAGLGEWKQDVSLVDRTTTYMYDRALKQSQHLATTRQRRMQPQQQQQQYGGGSFGTGTLAGSMLVPGAGTGSMLMAPGGMMASSTFQTGAVMAMAQTAVLGDSQGSVAPPPLARPAFGDHEDDLPAEADRVVGSGLGDSYVDGGKRVKVFVQQPDEEDDLEDGGVLGLLAQIYGGRGGLRA